MKERAMDYSREISIQRATELEQDVKPFIHASSCIQTGRSVLESRRDSILAVLGGSEKDWLNWKWHMKNRIKDSSILARLLGMSELERRRIDKVGKLYRWAISPYYLSLIGNDYLNDPIFKQAVPDIRELDGRGSLDPMNEALTSPAPCITRRYPDRLIINVTNQCAMYCRHCQRRRNIGEVDKNSCTADISKAIKYIADHDEIRDVLITGGDALMLSDRTIDWILSELNLIPHVEMKRIGTRVPVTLPQRITPELCEILRRYPPLYINTQFNHPLEITAEAKTACDRLAESGVVLGNQAVLLKGINDDPYVMRKLNHELLRIRVRPYYLFHAKDVKGTIHWQTSVQKGVEIMDSLRGHTSGLGIPTYIVNAPGGLGKIPVSPDYVLQMADEKVVLRTWEGIPVEIHNEYSD